MICSPVLKITIKTTTRIFVINISLLVVSKSPAAPPAIMAIPILKTLLSANLYIKARIKINKSPGNSRKNSTIPLSNGSIKIISAR
jgi:hypothetical protein